MPLNRSADCARSTGKVQMMADVLGHPIVVSGVTDTTAFGAAVLGMVATGDLESVHAVGRLMPAQLAAFQPDASRHRTYSELFAIYERVYQSLLGAFDDIARFQG
jgi:gluconokinase